MIKDLKFALKCMKYAHNRKMLSGMFVFFIFLGIMNFSMGREYNYITGGFMLVVAPSLLCQLYQTVNMSNLVVSSPKKKWMETRVLTLLNCICVLIGFIFFSIAISVVYLLGKCPAEGIGFLFAVQGILDIIMLVYMAFSYKHYVISTIGFVVSFFAFFIGCMAVQSIPSVVTSISITAGIGIAAVCIIVGCLLFLGVSNLVYKHPMDKRAMQSTLKMEL